VCSMKVSAHFLVRRSGAITQFVDCEDRAWHAGQSSFAGREHCNDFSIGIELEGRDDGLFTGAQYQVLAALTRALQQQYPGIGNDRVVGHQDIAPGRKTDPGSGFDWSRFRAMLE
ncbi:MAG: 1,6-anhydro-N-acetylmuramyl-L-alanine amidase AmpD, partial [Gammaproteobacteria bacterium]|nr:1,6-anhydro-N-acetylmuramyl-L-alanine amidase AmpD [Gammaproteobacteria bacterium]